MTRPVVSPAAVQPCAHHCQSLLNVLKPHFVDSSLYMQLLLLPPSAAEEVAAEASADTQDATSERFRLVAKECLHGVASPSRVVF